MRMDHLQYLIEIDKRHSISAAAQELYLGQTTLSSIVKSVEEELGFPIFHRTHNGVQTTPEGEEALALIWGINACYERIRQLSAHSGAASPVPLILSPSINAALALPLNQMFLEREPDGNLEFHSVIGDEVGTQIIKNEGNIGLTYFSKSNLENYRIIASKYQIEVDILMKDHLYLWMRQDHALAHREFVSMQEVNNCHFAILPHFDTSGDSMAYIKYFGTGNHYTTFPNVTLIQEAVYTQNMVAILSGYACGHSQYSEFLRAVRLNGTRSENEICLCLIHRSDSNIRYQEKVVIQCIKEYFQEKTDAL